jgi:glucosamine--fructose-6-phosphate aminotransferase (isomerizing)
LDFTKFDRIILIACGTAYYAGAVAKYWFEQVAGIAVDIDVASEFRYRRPVLNERSLFIAISQSGETADTLAALRYCKENGLTTAALVNVMTSTMAREADISMPILAGPEIGVASTKAFTAQLTALAALALSAAKTRGTQSDAEITRLTAELVSVPRLITEALELDTIIAEMAKTLAPSRSAFYLGRGAQVPIAYEGALKIKEIAYIHAEGYAAGELKHGPIALIEDGTPVIVLAPMDELYEKTVSNLQEVASRGARVTLVTDVEGAKTGASMADDLIIIPTSDPFVAPLLTTVAMQLLAYHTAVALGTDVDQPRNLAKSVTVE